MNRSTSPKVFYGWWIVVVSVICMAVSPGPLAFFTMGVFMSELTGEFDWTRAQVSGAITIGALSIAACVPFAGRLIDRFGVRPVLLTTMSGFAFTFASLYLLRANIWHLYVIFTFIGVFTSPVSVSFARTISLWFDHKRGLALGIAMSGIGLGAATMPLLSQYLNTTIGWRLSYVALSCISLIITFLLVGLIIHETPQSMDGVVDAVAEVLRRSGEDPGRRVALTMAASASTPCSSGYT